MESLWKSRTSSLRKVAFDTNALIYYLERTEPYFEHVAMVITLMEAGQIAGVISTVAEMELLVKPMRDRDAAARDKAEAFLRGTPNLAVQLVDRVVARRAADVRARTSLPAVDSIIVATALEQRCEAIIGNDAAIASRADYVGIRYLYLGDYV